MPLTPSPHLSPPVATEVLPWPEDSSLALGRVVATAGSIPRARSERGPCRLAILLERHGLELVLMGYEGSVGQAIDGLPPHLQVRLSWLKARCALGELANEGPQPAIDAACFLGHQGSGSLEGAAVVKLTHLIELGLTLQGRRLLEELRSATLQRSATEDALLVEQEVNIMLQEDNIAEARMCVQRAMTHWTERGETVAIAILRWVMARVEAAAGGLVRALALLDGLSSLVLRLPELNNRLGPIKAMRAAILYEQGLLHDASVELKAARRLLENADEPRFEGQLALLEMRLAEAQRPGERAWFDAFVRGRRLARAYHLPWLEPRLDLLRLQLDAAWAEGSSDTNRWRNRQIHSAAAQSVPNIDFRLSQPALAFGFAELRRGYPDKARALGKEIVADARRAGRLLCEVNGWVLLAAAAEAEAELPTEALQFWCRAATLAAPHSCVGPFVGLPDALLKRAIQAARFIGEDHLCNLLNEHQNDRIKRSPSAPLSDREREVLTHVAQGLSNMATAKRLGVSNATVKKHLENIYRKLGARGRTRALHAARRSGLIE